MRSAVLPVTLALAFGSFAAVLFPSSAQAERPRSSYVWVDESEADIAEPNSHTSNVIFLNRCKGGCEIRSGRTDSKTNRSTIVRSTVTVSEWSKGDEQWEELVDCVKAMYDPYDIVITDVDPGPNVDHFEAIVAGTAREVGLQSGVGGISPFSCGIINNSLNFSFANEPFYADGIDSICETVAQETAHSFGLEHAYLCSDPMTYLSPCGPTWFQNTNAPCGEFSPAACQCRNSQNSHQILENHCGVGADKGPSLSLKRPLPNSNVEPNFVIEVDGDEYYYGVSNVEVFVNGTSVGSSSLPPYIFNAPAGLSGFTTIEVRGRDIRGYEGVATAEINVGEACTPGSCEAGRVCYKSFCIEDDSTEGGFASSCQTDATCNSKICAMDSDGAGTCTEECELNNGDCPAGFGCTEAGAANVCWPGVSEGGGSGGCACNSGNGSAGLLGMFLVLFVLSLQRRRRAS
jgi:MYXO-CTERM domain-containing protein